MNKLYTFVLTAIMAVSISACAASGSTSAVSGNADAENASTETAADTAGQYVSVDKDDAEGDSTEKSLAESESAAETIAASEEETIAALAADYHAENEYMELAIGEAREGIYNSHGGPFGSVIVRDGKIIGQGHNMVLLRNDSTLHGEIAAIRNAESSLCTFDLSGAELYTTGEPCPMCLAACMWANIDKVYYGCTIEDNEMIGFRDKKFDEMFGGREAFADYLVQLDRDACLKLFEEYKAMDAQNY